MKVKLIDEINKKTLQEFVLFGKDRPGVWKISFGIYSYCQNDDIDDYHINYDDHLH